MPVAFFSPVRGPHSGFRGSLGYDTSVIGVPDFDPRSNTAHGIPALSPFRDWRTDPSGKTRLLAWPPGSGRYQNYDGRR